MTIQEIKDLVDKRIAGQGNQVDCGSALPSVLNELVDLVGAQAETIATLTEEIAKAPKPLVLSALPEDGDDLDDLAAKGLTLEAIKGLAEGKYSCIYFGEYWAIAMAYYRDDTGHFSICFRSFANDESTLDNTAISYLIEMGAEGVEIKRLEF